MKVSAKVKNNVDTKKVKKKTKQWNIKSAEHAVACIRKTVLNSFRKGTISKAKKTAGQRLPSKPGSTPRRWENKSGHGIVYGSYPALQSRHIGYKVTGGADGQTTAMLYASPRESGDKIMQMHEMGGSQYFTAIVDNRGYRRDKLPGWKENHWKPMEQRSAGQQKAIRDYYGNIKKKVKKRGKYPARPFLKPAVKKHIAKIPEYWRNRINLYFR